MLRKALLCSGLALTLLGCSVLSTPVAAPSGTPARAPVKSAKLTKTARAMQSPAPSPSTTREPTETIIIEPSATLEPVLPFTPTLPFLVLHATPTQTALSASPVPTATVQSELDCKLIWQSPGNGATYNPLTKFTTGWKVMNTGTAAWDAGSVQFTYLDGAKLHNDPSFPLLTGVSPGQAIILSVPMKAPRNSTKYTTYWGLRRGDTFFCRLKLSIYVQ